MLFCGGLILRSESSKSLAALRQNADPVKRRADWFIDEDSLWKVAAENCRHGGHVRLSHQAVKFCRFGKNLLQLEVGIDWDRGYWRRRP